MTRRPGKAQPCPGVSEKSTPRTHQKRHLHLTNNIHVKNHIHMMQQQSRSRMLDAQQQLPGLRRELTAATKKVKALQDPSTSSSFSPASACSSVNNNSGGGDELHERARRQARRRIAREAQERRESSIRRDADAALAQWNDRNRDHLFAKARDQRWQGDAEEIARRLIAEQTGGYMKAHGLMSMLGEVTTSDSFLESEDGEPGARPRLSNSAGSPLVRSHQRTVRRAAARAPPRVHREMISDELDVSDMIPAQNGCGMPWYWTQHKYNKGKSLLDLCAFPDSAAPVKTTSSDVSSRHGLENHHYDVPDDAPAGSVKLAPSTLGHKYRPKSFRDMVGQALVVRSLTTAITKGKVAPVYLFAGPRGTGKTTCARVFAAALVCLNTEPHRRPCGLCRECATITLNRSRDVKEVDVASCADIDHVKALLAPSNARGHQQVFIVEGCDSLTVEIWTAFLKFLDDPPRNVVFILITTDGLERVPMVATSRCQKFHFGKLKESEIVTRLQALAEKESLEVDEAALMLISSRADGSLRDAESMLDQLSLLDQRITLATVQELSGLIPDEKLVNLLDMALAADTMNTVKGMRALLDAGVDALSLVAQLASLITNILAGTFDLRRESRKKGFFNRSLPRREEQQRLRQALKVLAECEKQLRASNDRPTWLTAALLQFAPDRSYLPSSVDTSMAPSPIAFDTFERVPGEPCTPRLPQARKHHDSPKHSPRELPRHSHEKSPAKVHPDHHHGPASSLVLFDPARAIGNRDFRVLPRRDMEDVWDKVLEGCRSNVLRQLLSTQGTLMALAVARDETFAVAHVEFRSPEHKARAERLRSSTCHAFQMALGCPVELKLSLECPPSVVMEEIKASHAVAPPSETADPSVESPPQDEEAALRDQRRTPKTSRQEMLTGLAARSRRLGDHANCVESRDSSIRESNKYCFPAAGSSRRHRLGRRPSLNRMASGRQLDAAGVKRVSVRWRYPKFKGIANLERRRNRKLEPRRKRTRVALCWQSPMSEREPELQQDLQQPERQPEQRRKVTFLLRLVPCGRSTQTHGSPNRP